MHTTHLNKSSQDEGEQQTCNTQTNSSQQSAPKRRKGDTHCPNEAKMLRQPPPHRNDAQCCFQVQIQPKANKQNTKGETKTTTHKHLCQHTNTTMPTSHECVQTKVLAKNATHKFNTKESPLFPLWVLINTINECALPHHNVHPPMSPSTIVPFIYHQGLPSSNAPFRATPSILDTSQMSHASLPTNPHNVPEPFKNALTLSQLPKSYPWIPPPLQQCLTRNDSARSKCLTCHPQSTKTTTQR